MSPETRKRVLLITGSFPPVKCGVSDYVVRLVTAMKAYPEYEFGIVSGSGAETISGVPGIGVYPAAGSWRFRDARKLFRTIREWSPDIVHIQYPGTGYRNRWFPLLLPLLLKLKGFRVVQTWHEIYPGLKGKIAFLPNTLSGGPILVNRDDLLDSLPRWWRQLLSKEDVFFIPVGPNIDAATLAEGERQLLRSRLAGGGKRLLVYFGFLTRAKGAHVLVDLVDPSSDHLVAISDLSAATPYEKEVSRRLANAEAEGWATIKGFLSADEAARILAAADALLLPFEDGAGPNHGSYQAAIRSGSFLVTTSRRRRGYDPVLNAYFAQPGNVAEMRAAILERAGTRREAEPSGALWAEIARSQRAVYQRALGESRVNELDTLPPRASRRATQGAGADSGGG